MASAAYQFDDQKTYLHTAATEYRAHYDSEDRDLLASQLRDHCDKLRAIATTLNSGCIKRHNNIQISLGKTKKWAFCNAFIFWGSCLPLLWLSWQTCRATGVVTALMSHVNEIPETPREMIFHAWKAELQSLVLSLSSFVVPSSRTLFYILLFALGGTAVSSLACSLYRNKLCIAEEQETERKKILADVLVKLDLVHLTGIYQGVLTQELVDFWRSLPDFGNKYTRGL